MVQRKDTGRPEIVYGRRCKPEDIEHELRVAELEIILACEIERSVRIGRTTPDGVLIRDGERCAIEVDNGGKMTAKQMEAKWKRYEGFTGIILVIAMTERRMQRLRTGA